MPKITGVSRPAGWETPDPGLRRLIESHRAAALGSFKANPLLISEQAHQEDSYRTGGYAERQILELVQNAGDALTRGGSRGQVTVLIRNDTLYCANEGAPFSQKGIEAVCQAYMSPKRGDEIGRFGLGFKSVLAVTDDPLILSRSISFGFHADAAREMLQPLAPEATAFPVLRLPFEVDLESELSADPVLADFARWATTIVTLPIARHRDRLVADLNAFQHEFLLFAPMVDTLCLAASSGPENSAVANTGKRELPADRAPDDSHVDSSEDVEDTGNQRPVFGAPRTYRCTRAGPDRWLLQDDADVETEWLVVSERHRPSEAALNEVGEAIARAEIAVTYAAPIDDAQGLGQFWAHFPLQDTTSARGIFNAPWRINDDRTSLLPGVFNDEILSVAARLVVEALPRLTTGSDPARHFDYLPARGREAPNFADKALTVLVPALAQQTRCLPDQDGTLRKPDALQYPDFDLRLDPPTLYRWADAPGRPVLWAHPSCYRSATRRARLRTLVREDDARRTEHEVNATTWLEELVAPGTDDQCAAALEVFRSVRDENIRREMTQARIIPDGEDKLHRLADIGGLFLRGTPLSESTGLRLARATFLDLPGVEDHLRTLDFVDVDPAVELRRLCRNVGSRWTAKDWTDFWNLVDEVDQSEAAAILDEHVESGRLLKVRVQDGTWQAVGTVIIAGRITPTDKSLVLDTEFHGELAVFERLGITTRPVLGRSVLQDLTLLEYQRLLRTDYLARLPARGRPNREDIHFRETRGPGPLHILRRFVDTDDLVAAQEWSRMLLDFDADDTWVLAGGKPKLPAFKVRAPHLWAVNRYGRLPTGWGPRPASQTLHPDLGGRWGHILPVASVASASKIDTVPDLDHLPLDVWREFIDRTPIGGTAYELGDLLHRAHGRLPTDEVPDLLPCVRGSSYDHVDRLQVLIARTDDECRVLRERERPFVAVPSDAAADALIGGWQCQPAADVMQVRLVTEEPSEPVILLDRYRRLRDYNDGELDTVQLVACASLLEVISEPDGTTNAVRDVALDERNTVFYDQSVGEEDLLSQVSSLFGLDLDDLTIAKILSDAHNTAMKERVAACRAQSDPIDKLLALLPTRALESRLPIGLLNAVRADAGDLVAVVVEQLDLHHRRRLSA